MFILLAKQQLQGVPKMTQLVFLELRQISTKSDNFWCT